jgi:hypothetical protein
MAAAGFICVYCLMYFFANFDEPVSSFRMARLFLARPLISSRLTFSPLPHPLIPSFISTSHAKHTTIFLMPA